MFGFSKKEQPPQKSHRDIVYDFAEILGQLNLPILDERLLPHPKQTIISAFAVYIAQLSARARYDPLSHSELDRVCTLEMHICNFQPIEPEDIQIVMDINSSPRFKRFRDRPPAQEEQLAPTEQKDFETYFAYVSKYQLRAFEEQNINEL